MKDLWIAGISTGPDAATCLLKNDQVVFMYLEQELSGIPNDHRPLLGLLEITKHTDHLDCFIQTNYENITEANQSIYIHLLRKLGLYESIKNLNNCNFKSDHHKYHAASVFYSSGYDRAGIVVIDRDDAHGDELVSIFKAEYPHDIGLKYVRKKNDATDIKSNFFLAMKALQASGSKNLLVSGSAAEDFVSTLDFLDKDTNIFVDPKNNDSGLAWGAAQYMHKYYNWKHNLPNSEPKRLV